MNDNDDIQYIKKELLKLKDIFDYFIDSYGLPENIEYYDFDELLKRVENLENCKKNKEELRVDNLNELEAIKELTHLFILDCLSNIEEEINNINQRKRNFINMRDKIRKIKKR